MPCKRFVWPSILYVETVFVMLHFLEIVDRQDFLKDPINAVIFAGPPALFLLSDPLVDSSFQPKCNVMVRFLINIHRCVISTICCLAGAICANRHFRLFGQRSHTVTITVNSVHAGERLTNENSNCDET